MKAPGELSGPMGLPVSYTNEQLSAFKWDAEKRIFRRSKLKTNSKVQTGPTRRFRAASHYWKTKEYKE